MLSRMLAWPLLFLFFPLLDGKEKRKCVVHQFFFTPYAHEIPHRKSLHMRPKAAGLESHRKGKTLEK